MGEDGFWVARSICAHGFWRGWFLDISIWQHKWHPCTMTLPLFLLPLTKKREEFDSASPLLTTEKKEREPRRWCHGGADLGKEKWEIGFGGTRKEEDKRGVVRVEERENPNAYG
ncbi:hypothetical protein ACFX2I_015792 [Malus domestica]